MQAKTPNIEITEEMIDATTGVFIDYDANMIDHREAAKEIYLRMLRISKNEVEPKPSRFGCECL